MEFQKFKRIFYPIPTLNKLFSQITSHQVLMKFLKHRFKLSVYFVMLFYYVVVFLKTADNDQRVINILIKVLLITNEYY